MNTTSATIQITAALGTAIRDLTAASPLGGVPSGELYARVMGNLTLAQYQSIINALKSAKLVSERGHLLVWVGPKS